MPIYTVHEPPLRKSGTLGETAPDPERFVFVREGFRLWAFLLTPLWMIARRLWLVLVLYLALNAAITAALYFSNAPGWARFGVMLLVALLVGLEAPTLQRWTLTRRKWKTVGTVSGETAEAAERRFFDRWVAQQSAAPNDRATSITPAQPAAPPPVAVTPRMSAGDSGVLGLFPRPSAP